MPHLVEDLIAAASAHPAKLAVVDSTRRLTYRRLAAFAAAVCRIIHKETDCPRVGLVLPSSAAMAGSFYGVLWAGRIAIPLNFLLQPRELAGVVADARIDTIITVRFFAKALADLPVRKLYLEELGLKWRVPAESLRPRPPVPSAGPGDIAVILYTSGTSGLPKGVCLSHGNLASNARASIEYARMNHDQRFLGVIPQFHSFGLTALLLIPVTLGATIYYMPRFSPVGAVERIQRDGISIFLAIPSMYNAIARLKNVNKDAFRSLTLAVSGGEPLPPRTATLFRERFGLELLEGYGLTETSPVLSINMPWAHQPGSVGRALPGVRFRIVDEDGKDAATGQPGEILAQGPGIMKEYYLKPEDTRAAIDPAGWFHTGDIGTLDADGYLSITGRKKEMIIVGGENVYPAEVENVLCDHPAVSEAAVVGRADSSRGEVVVAYVILDEDQTVDELELREFCRSRLAGCKVPREIKIATDLPRGPTGKILKRALGSRPPT